MAGPLITGPPDAKRVPAGKSKPAGNAGDTARPTAGQFADAAKRKLGKNTAGKVKSVPFFPGITQEHGPASKVPASGPFPSNYGPAQ